MSKLVIAQQALEDALRAVESELHIVCDKAYGDDNFDEKSFDRLRKIHRYLEKSIKIAEGKKKNVKK